MQRFLRVLAAAAALGLTAPGPAITRAAEGPKVVTSIKPVHSLVAGVMVGAGSPALLVPGGGSPHAYTLRPSQARRLQEADLVFWIGDGMETFLAKPLGALARGARVVALYRAPGGTLLATRRGGVWDDHGAARDEAASAQREPNHDDNNAHGSVDMHVWLDPANAQAMAGAIAEALAETDPANAARYRANGEDLRQRLGALDRELRRTLAPVAARPYVVFHDAYQYFEARYGLSAAGAITVSPGRPPGARRLAEIRARIVATGARCVFAEPQFPPPLVRTVIEDTAAKAAILDPLGAELTAGPETYFTLMRALARALADCLASTS